VRPTVGPGEVVVGVDDLLGKNRAWAAFEVAKDPHFFARHEKGQNPRLLWIGCSDSRVPAEQVLACQPGEVFVHRNIANIVSYNDVNLTSVVQYAVENLKIEDIAVVGHYGCGGVKASCQEKVVGGYLGDWLMIAGWAKRFVEDKLKREGKERPSEEEFLQMVVEENVALQMMHLSALSVLRGQWEKTPGVPRIHGWIYDIRSGLIKVVDPRAANITVPGGEL
jgi:carbonic anhydrase